MSYQELIVVDSVKEGLMDSTVPSPRGDAWVFGTHAQGLRYANDGKTILIATSLKAIAPGGYDEATWSTAQAHGAAGTGIYSALLDKPAAAVAGSCHVQFTPTTRLTLQDLEDAIATGGAGALDPEWSFWYHLFNAAGNYVQWEFRFEDPGSDAWLEVTALPLQGNPGGAPGPWTQAILTGAMLAGSGGNTPDGSGVFLWPPGTLTNLETLVEAGWEAAEPGTGAATANYLLERVRLELWEAAPVRNAYVDDVVIDGVAYDIEPGMAGGQLSKPTPLVTLTFVAYRDIYGRTETLAPVVGAEQSVMVGPLLPALFNDSDGYVKFEPSAGDSEVTYRVIRVSNPS